ncbi:MAG: hypothetical protein AAF602_16750 [Myxococcota bacterium]
MDALSPRPKALPDRITGQPLQWGRDLSAIGAVTAAGGSLALGLLGSTFGLVAVTVAAVLGLVIGLEMPGFLDSARRRMSLEMVALRCVAVGGAAGGLVGLIAAGASGNPWFLGPMVVGALAGALQFGWWWLPYTVLTVTERPTWPAVLVACGLAPLMGPMALTLASWIGAAIV